MGAQQKSAMLTRRQEQARKRLQQAMARKACVDAVWRRGGVGDGLLARCEGLPGKPCGRVLFRGSTLWGGDVDEIVSRAQGGDPTDPNNCRLLCYQCHFSGPSGAHRVTPNWRKGRV